MKRQIKSFTFKVKAVDDELGLIEAYGSVFDIPDQGNETVRPGAFKRTIMNAKSRVKAGKAKFLAMMLWQHNADNPIGGWYDLVEDSYGLKCKGQIILSTQLGRECYELIKAGVINEFSIGYDIMPGGATFDKSNGNLNLIELRLWEVSPVTFAMHQDALLLDVKKNKDKTMPERKDFNDHYRQEAIEDWLYYEFNNLTCALKASLIDIFSIGDTPNTDVLDTILQDSQDNKQGFISALEAWVQRGVDLDASNYLQETLEAHGSNGSGLYSGYMSRDTSNLEHKAGRAISGANAQKIQDHIDAVKSMVKEHQKSMNAAADDLATVLQGSEAAYGTDEGDAVSQQQGKAAPSHETHGENVPYSLKSTKEDEDFDAALSQIRLLRTK